jgi:hypothetical protein
MNFGYSTMNCSGWNCWNCWNFGLRTRMSWSLDYWNWTSFDYLMNSNWNYGSKMKMTTMTNCWTTMS